MLAKPESVEGSALEGSSTGCSFNGFALCCNTYTALITFAMELQLKAVDQKHLQHLPQTVIADSEI